MGRKGLLIVAMLIIVSLSLVMVSAELPHTITFACTVKDNVNCLDVHCSIVAAGSNNQIYANEYNGTHYIKSTTLLKDSQYNFTVRNPTELQGLSAECEIPEFNTKYCTYRGEWVTSVDVVRRYKPSESNSVSSETFSLKQVPAFKCKDWIPPRVTVLSVEPNYAKGTRIVTITITDDERNIAANDDTNLSFCAYTTSSEELSLTTILDHAEGEAPSPWVALDECEGEMSAFIVLPAHPSSEYIYIYAEDEAGNYVYHTVEPTPLYPSIGQEGYCPRPNECFVYASGDHEVNDFELIYIPDEEEGTIIPLCVKAGSTINDVYCDADRGLMSKSERLYEIARAQSQGMSGEISIYCANIDRIRTLDSGNPIPTFCPFSFQNVEGNCVNSCTLHEVSSSGRTTLLYTSMNRPDNLYIPGILPTSIPSSACNAIINPYNHLKCTYNYRQQQQLYSFYYNHQGLFHIGTQDPGRVNLSIPIQRQLHEETLAIKLRERISNYFTSEFASGNGNINQSVFLGSKGGYQYAAYRKNDGRSALALRINLASVNHEVQVVGHSFIVGAVYHNYDGERVEEYAKSVASAYPLRKVKVYHNNDYTIVVGTVSSNSEAAIVIEQLVVRLRPGGLS